MTQTVNVSFQRYGKGYQYVTYVKHKGKMLLVHSPDKAELERFLSERNIRVASSKLKLKRIGII